MNIIPRIIRLKDAPDYLGTCKNYFNENIRPYLIEIPIGEKGVGFDRMDLNRWVAYTKRTSGRPPKWELPVCEKKNHIQGCTYETASGQLIKKLTENEYAKVRELAILKKRKNI